MRWTALTAIAAAAAVAFAAVPADAATRKKVRSYQSQQYVQTTGRAPARITVRRARSFLDPGTEVLPRSQPYTDYALPPLSYPNRNWDVTDSYRFPLPRPLELPGYTWY
jgi:hypothetical protein